MASYKKIGDTGIEYSKQKLLGKGTYGAVYLGVYKKKEVAVKKILLNTSKNEEREVDIQENLDHENVLKILKVEEDEDFRYIVLELCAGTLSQVINKTYEGPAYPSDVIVLFQIADGLDYIHSQKLIHRDIKPDNILISMNGQLKLSDFGLSKQISTRDTCSMSGMKGTLLWMAPELRAYNVGVNNKATPKCDVFPCGCVFFVFLTREHGGIHPFGDVNGDHLEVQNNIRDGKLINFEKLKPNNHAAPVIREMIEADPLKRIHLANAKERLRLLCNPNLQTLREPERAAVIVRRASKKCFGDKCPGIDFYTLPLKKHHGAQTQGIGHYYVFGAESSYLALTGKRRQRTILMLGETGSGKSTLINAMVNYMMGVEWDDDFRFKLIDEPADKSQAHSQTDLVTTYDLHEMKGSRLNYSLTVVDTPGFGDTRGLEQDKKIMQQIQDYFQCRHGIQQLEAVCFVVQSSLPRLTATQQYIFDSILSIFGQDIKENILLMVTFADNALPPVLGTVIEAGIPSPMDPATGLPIHHKFNNSIFFTSNKGGRQTNELNRTYFEMAVKGFDKFFGDLSGMEAKSLTLTREVLEERKRLEAHVEGLQLLAEIKLTRIDEFQQIKKILTKNKDQIEANKNFEFEVEVKFLVPKVTDISGTGQFTTNCQKCRTTCHFPCSQVHHEDKHRCSVMNSSGHCMICKCHWKDHYNQKYRYEMVKEKVQRSSVAIRQQYQGAKNEAVTNEQLLARIQKEIDEYEAQLMGLRQGTYPCIQRLNEIALRPHPFSVPAYIDFMIAAEKEEHRPGYQQRIVDLQKLRQMAEITAKLICDQQSTRLPPPTTRPQRRTDGV